jgi:primary-amine oxidase
MVRTWSCGSISAVSGYVQTAFETHTNFMQVHHFTRSEDVPVTLYTEAYSSIVFAPQNFNDRAQDGDLLNRRWMEVDDEGVLTYETYGVGLDTCLAVSLAEPAEHLIS